MIFYTYKNITIGQFDLMLSDKEEVLSVKIPMPKKWIEKRVSKIITEFNKHNSKKEINSKLLDEFHKLSLTNRINNLLPSLYYGFKQCEQYFLLTGKVHEHLETFKTIYESMFNCKPTSKGIDAILSEINKLKETYEDLYTQEESSQDGNKSFSHNLIMLEMILESGNPKFILRNKPLNKWQIYVDMATDINKSRITKPE